MLINLHLLPNRATLDVKTKIFIHNFILQCFCIWIEVLVPLLLPKGLIVVEVLEDVEGGWTVPWADPEALAAVIRGALAERADRPDAWERRVATARQHILDRYTWDAATDTLLGVYERAITGGAARGAAG